MLTPSIEDRGHYSRSLVAGIPDLLACHQQHPERYPFLLESASKGCMNARYSILMACPGQTLTLTDLGDDDFLTALDAEWRAQRFDSNLAVDELPFRGGWFLFLSYELLGQVEPTVAGLTQDPVLPLAQMTRIPAAIIIDSADQCCWIVAESGREDLIQTLHDDLVYSAPQLPYSPFSVPLVEESESAFVEGVKKSLDYCREGDIFQANLSRQWQGQLPRDVSYQHVYQRLREYNPAPFAGFAVLGDAIVCSSSPERLVRVERNQIGMRPIAGTRPRGQVAGADRDFSDELLANPKERAEHLMLLDLIRNDLGRVSEYGSVRVDEHMILESYATVHHIVSNVVGRKRRSVTPGDVIRAVFPGGTITGCPKVRCMQIIAELEQSARGAYTGSMGYLNRDGDMDLNILIRTLVIDGQGLRFRAGAGIVADSDPHAELQETWHKAQGMMNALQGAGT